MPNALSDLPLCGCTAPAAVHPHFRGGLPAAACALRHRWASLTASQPQILLYPHRVLSCCIPAALQRPSRAPLPSPTGGAPRARRHPWGRCFPSLPALQGLGPPCSRPRDLQPPGVARTARRSEPQQQPTPIAASNCRLGADPQPAARRQSWPPPLPPPLPPAAPKRHPCRGAPSQHGLRSTDSGASRNGPTAETADLAPPGAAGAAASGAAGRGGAAAGASPFWGAAAGRSSSVGGRWHSWRPDCPCDQHVSAAGRGRSRRACHARVGAADASGQTHTQAGSRWLPSSLLVACPASLVALRAHAAPP